MTVGEFLQVHPGEEVDLQVSEGRILLERGQVRRLLAGRPACGTPNTSRRRSC